MGKPKLSKIENESTRKSTFVRRKVGLIKKAHEMSVLCDCDIAIMVMDRQNRCFTYANDGKLGYMIQRYQNQQSLVLPPNHTQLDTLQPFNLSECTVASIGTSGETTVQIRRKNAHRLPEESNEKALSKDASPVTSPNYNIPPSNVPNQQTASRPMQLLPPNFYQALQFPEGVKYVPVISNYVASNQVQDNTKFMLTTPVINTITTPRMLQESPSFAKSASSTFDRYIVDPEKWGQMKNTPSSKGSFSGSQVELRPSKDSETMVFDE